MEFEPELIGRSGRWLAAALAAVTAAFALAASGSLAQAPPVGAADPAEAVQPVRPAAGPAPSGTPGAQLPARTAASIEREEEVLDDRMAFIERRLTESLSRVESLLMAVELEVLKVQKRTLAYHRELERVRVELSEQERLAAQDVRNKERLVELMERYGAGDWVARHVKVELENFRRRGRPQRSADQATLQRRVREFRQALFELGALSFRVDSDARSHEQALAAQGRTTPELRSRLKDLVESRKEALQEQERVLTGLAERAARLAELQRRREDQIESLYTFVLGRMLWLRNREPLGPFLPNRALLAQALDAGLGLSGRLGEWSRLQSRTARSRFAGSWWPWLAAVLVFGLAPWLAVRGHGALRDRVARQRARPGRVPAHRAALLLALHAAVWPGYLVLVTLALPQLGLLQDGSLGPALTGALQLAALVLWIGLVGESVFRPDGHGERRWGLAPEAARALRFGSAAGCAAALALLVPRHVLLHAPGDDVAASLALARLLMIAFTLAVLALVAVGCRRRSSLMEAALRRSRSSEGFLWSVWPLVHFALMAVFGGIVALNLAGYQYASQFVWQRIVRSTLTVLSMLLVSFYLKSGVRALSGKVAARRAGTDGGQADGGRAGRLAWVVVDVPLGILGVVVQLEIWGVSVVDFLATPLGGTVLFRGVLMALVVAAGLGLVRLSNVAVLSLLRPRVLDRVRSRETGRRLQTLAPLAQTSIKLLVVLVGFFLLLQLAGIETGPLLAGVGIVGLAVGFAAQSLIKDVINGLFILTEGSVGAGDVVEVGGVSGVVEKVTLRSVRIRDLSGNVHFVPNSTIDHVQNMTKDYSRYLLDVGVAYREDTDEVVAALKDVDEAMRQDPQFRYDMLEPIEIMGVDRFEDSAVVVRARLKTRPIQQWRIGREFNRRLKKAFDEKGIEIPFPHQTVYWGETKQGQLPLQVETRRGKDAAAEPAAPDPETRKGTSGTGQVKSGS